MARPCSRTKSEFSKTRMWSTGPSNSTSREELTVVGMDTARPVQITVHSMIYTIGHSNHSIEQFVALLKRHEITALADVRSTPYSRFNPQFRRESLQTSLAGVGIQYVFLGEELGARSRDPEVYDLDGRVSYLKLAATALFKKGIERLKNG